MDIMSAIDKRISIRSYDARPVEDCKIEQIAYQRRVRTEVPAVRPAR